MNLAEMLRGNPLAQKRLADNFAMDQQGDLARMMQQHGTVQDPARVQEQSVLGNLPMDVPQPTQADMLMGADQVMNLMPQAGIFAGIGSKTANKLALQKAQDLAGQGVNRKQVWDETGWYNDVDGKWKYEIDDSGLQAGHGLDIGIMNDTARHEKLNAAYPEMRKTMVTNKKGSDARGSYSPGESRESMGLFDIDPEIKTFGDTTEQTRSVLAHELQHGVQEADGFAKGGSPELFTAPRDQALARVNFLNNEMSVAAKALDKYGAYGKANLGFEKEYAHFRKQYDDSMNEKMQVWDESTKDPYQQYKKLAGEAEARNVQKRLDWTPAQRKAAPPWLTLDVPENELLVRMLRDQQFLNVVGQDVQ